MSIQLPGELADLLNDLGFSWPKSDEDKLYELGQTWVSFSSTLAQVSSDAGAAAQRVWNDNTGDAVDAFKNRWSDGRAAPSVLGDGVSGAQAVGGALFVCAGIVLALKINVIVQLTILAIEIIQAIATAPETFGGSLLEIPIFKKLTGMAINLIISQAVEAILG